MKIDTQDITVALSNAVKRAFGFGQALDRKRDGWNSFKPELATFLASVADDPRVIKAQTERQLALALLRIQTERVAAGRETIFDHVGRKSA